MASGVRLAVVGATGAVGQEMLKVLEERDFPAAELLCLADPSEAGSKLKFKDQTLTVGVADAQAFKQSDLALFAVGTDVSRALAPLAMENDCVVIDNSYAFRLDDNVPLVVPEVNAAAAASHQGIIANPNCSTIIMVSHKPHSPGSGHQAGSSIYLSGGFRCRSGRLGGTRQTGPPIPG